MEYLRATELFGPCGAGKTTIYNRLLELGGIASIPRYKVEDAFKILNNAIYEDVLDLYAYIDKEFGKWDFPLFPIVPEPYKKTGSRMCGVLRSLSKIELVRRTKAPEGYRYAVIDGGVLHLAQSIDRMGLDYEEYVRHCPVLPIVFYVTAPLEVLKQRNEERGERGETDRADEVDRSVEVCERVAEIVRERGGTVREIDGTNEVNVNAADIAATLSDKERKYTGIYAEVYDKRREKQARWHWEQGIIEGMLDDVPEGEWILDVPVGTGRFFPYYAKRRFLVRGMDKSADMLKQAEPKSGDLRHYHEIEGMIQEIPLDDKSNYASVMCRLTRWLSPEDCQVALKELQRVTTDKIIFTCRTEDKNNPRPIKLFEDALVDGWKIHRVETMPEDPAYTVVEVRHGGQ